MRGKAKPLSAQLVNARNTRVRLGKCVRQMGRPRWCVGSVVQPRAFVGVVVDTTAVRRGRSGVVYFEEKEEMNGKAKRGAQKRTRPAVV